MPDLEETDLNALPQAIGEDNTNFGNYKKKDAFGLESGYVKPNPVKK